MLLDDPLSHCDGVRREALAQLLAESGRERQLVVLSTDPAVADLLERTCEGCVKLDLDDLLVA